ncbi:MAG: redoxin domain-containing protein [Nitrospirae bacterium]|nr:redoxin domain-containing protein [Nitrospirota bacterium]
MARLQVGEAAPGFMLPDETGQFVSLRELRGKQVVLYFYPKGNCSGR